MPSPGFPNTMDADTQIFNNLYAGTAASVNTLALLSNAVDSEVQSLVAGEKDSTAGAIATAEGATSANSLLAKLKILQVQTQQATEATKRVQRSLANREDGPEATRRIWEDTNAFITVRFFCFDLGITANGLIYSVDLLNPTTPCRAWSLS